MTERVGFAICFMIAAGIAYFSISALFYFKQWRDDCKFDFVGDGGVRWFLIALRNLIFAVSLWFLFGAVMNIPLIES
jgi:hypothetical protein